MQTDCLGQRGDKLGDVVDGEVVDAFGAQRGRDFEDAGEVGVFRILPKPPDGEARDPAGSGCERNSGGNSSAGLGESPVAGS